MKIISHALNFLTIPVVTWRTKHIVIKYHFVQKSTLTREVKLACIPTKSEIADNFTKALAKDLFTKFRDLRLRVCSNDYLLENVIYDTISHFFCRIPTR